MIILDLSQVMISNLMSQIGTHTDVEVDEDLLRHMILNSIRSYLTKFRKKYGELVIACDAKNSWRRNVFPHYKANRKKARDKSEIDWTKVFDCLATLRDELKESFPYRVILADGAEADDIIGVLCKTFQDEPVLVLSGDKDFVQLQKYKNVEQYDPVRKKYLITYDAKKSLLEHIIRGDVGDGIPNILSPADCLVTGERQKSVFQAKLDVWLEQNPSDFCNVEMNARYMQNEQLIDLSFTPLRITEDILNQYEEQGGKDRGKLFHFFVEKRLKHLMGAIQEF